jgi:hypothetical protein
MSIQIAMLCQHYQGIKTGEVASTFLQRVIVARNKAYYNTILIYKMYAFTLAGKVLHLLTFPA